MMQHYGRLIIIVAVLATLVLLGPIFTAPLVFIFDLSAASLSQMLLGALCFGLTLLVARMVRNEVIHGWIEQRSGQILVITSASGARPVFGAPLYSSVRAGANMLVRGVAQACDRGQRRSL
jgi:NAD(P)-dependent dehydrogenase (short-subunit alcohol dehydrogenase family)